VLVVLLLSNLSLCFKPTSLFEPAQQLNMLKWNQDLA
jgi:hypothetical protein